MAEQRCRSCGAPIIWGKTPPTAKKPDGAANPFDADPTPTGRYTWSDRRGVMRLAEEPRDRDAKRYNSHFTTCKNPSWHSKSRKR